MTPIRIIAEVLFYLITAVCLLITLATLAPAAREAVERWAAAQGPNINASGDDDSRPEEPRR